MKRSLKNLLLIALGAVTTAGCTSLQSPRAQNAGGLLDFVLASPGANVVPVEKVSMTGGEVVTARAVSDGRMLRVSGLLSKPGLKEAPLGSHVDILLLNAKGKVSAAATAEYLPRALHRPSSRYGQRYSHYSAQLPLPPHPGVTVRVVFHGAPPAECQLAPKA